MHVQSLFVYPLKSVRPIALESTAIYAVGPLHDRIFLLQHKLPPPPAEPGRGPSHRNMHITHYPQLCLFLQEFLAASAELLVRYVPPHPEESRQLAVPLSPDTAGLVQREVVMHESACLGYDMGDSYAAFFTACLGFTARLVYLGSSRRPVLGNLAPAASAASRPDQISFADCAPLLIATQTSLDALSERIPGDEEMDITKLRPNIVLAADEDGELEPWEEDFWGAVEIAGHSVALTANCLRCKSINVRAVPCRQPAMLTSTQIDYTTGAPVAPNRQPLKLLMRDRRVDPGVRYSPVFGRYGFLPGNDGPLLLLFLSCSSGSDTPPDVGEAGMVVRVGDKVVVSKRNEERTVFGECPLPDRDCDCDCDCGQCLTGAIQLGQGSRRGRRSREDSGVGRRNGGFLSVGWDGMGWDGLSDLCTGHAALQLNGPPCASHITGELLIIPVRVIIYEWL